MGGGVRLVHVSRESYSSEEIAAFPSRAFLSNPQSPNAAVVGDSVWAASGGQLLLADTRSGRSRLVQAIDEVGGLAAGKRDVWVGDVSAGAIFRLDGSSGAFVGRTSVGGVPRDIAFDGQSVWIAVTELGTYNLRLARLQAESGVLLAQLGAYADTNGAAVQIAAGEGSVWLANSSRSLLTRVDPDTERVEASIGLPIRPDGVAVGAGYVWVNVY